MIDPARLLSQAQDLIAPRQGAPHQSDLRRAVSNAYYALFHHLVRSVSDHLVGSTPVLRKRPEYRLVYRSLQHGQMADSCEAVRRPTLAARYQRACNTTSFGQNIKLCAMAFTELQHARHAADYDPGQRFSKAEAAYHVAAAENAIVSFDGAPAAEKRIFLHLLAFKVRD